MPKEAAPPAYHGESPPSYFRRNANVERVMVTNLEDSFERSPANWAVTAVVKKPRSDASFAFLQCNHYLACPYARALDERSRDIVPMTGSSQIFLGVIVRGLFVDESWNGPGLGGVLVSSGTPNDTHSLRDARTRYALPSSADAATFLFSEGLFSNRFRTFIFDGMMGRHHHLENARRAGFQTARAAASAVSFLPIAFVTGIADLVTFDTLRVRDRVNKRSPWHWKDPGRPTGPKGGSVIYPWRTPFMGAPTDNEKSWDYGESMGGGKGKRG